ncbi:hypothetical protein ACH49_29640 [Streptomyces leeuwenhoekii]|uniref:Uncharacterized protein n=1 Tax=Streptomyces leeuwenhoekii TaxID=1437453 RepID=A0ABR5HQE1_STRLW|nr:hypothetical protein ACH49_29640 [Streptomyces leeuwenhoekii]
MPYGARAPPRAPQRGESTADESPARSERAPRARQPDGNVVRWDGSPAPEAPSAPGDSRGHRSGRWCPGGRRSARRTGRLARRGQHGGHRRARRSAAFGSGISRKNVYPPINITYSWGSTLPPG